MPSQQEGKRMKEGGNEGRKRWRSKQRGSVAMTNDDIMVAIKFTTGRGLCME